MDFPAVEVKYVNAVALSSRKVNTGILGKIDVPVAILNIKEGLI